MCDLCHGTGFLVRDVPMSHPDFGKAIPCACQADKRRATAQRKLEALDGLTPLERHHTFDNTYPAPEQEEAMRLLHLATVGIFVLQGNPGAGKSHLLHCVVNQARQQGRVAVYTTMTDLLDYLRATFAPNAEERFEDRWDLLKACEVLAIDELDEFKASDWAVERFLRLIDERWRNRDTQLTVTATNSDPAVLLPKVASRLRSGTVLPIRLGDLRKVFRAAVPA